MNVAKKPFLWSFVVIVFLSTLNYHGQQLLFEYFKFGRLLMVLPLITLVSEVFLIACILLRLSSMAPLVNGTHLSVLLITWGTFLIGVIEASMFYYWMLSVIVILGFIVLKIENCARLMEKF